MMNLTNTLTKAAPYIDWEAIIIGGPICIVILLFLYKTKPGKKVIEFLDKII